MTRLPLVPWLWPLALPTLLPIVSALISLLRRWEAAFSWRLEALPGLLPGFGVTVAFTLTLTLTPAVLALVALRRRADSDRTVRQGLLALWGLCLGLSLTWVLLLILPAGSQTLPNVVVWPPLLGYVAGRWVGGSQ